MFTIMLVFFQMNMVTFAFIINIKKNNNKPIHMVVYRN